MFLSSGSNLLNTRIRQKQPIVISLKQVDQLISFTPPPPPYPSIDSSNVRPKHWFNSGTPFHAHTTQNGGWVWRGGFGKSSRVALLVHLILYIHRYEIRTTVKLSKEESNSNGNSRDGADDRVGDNWWDIHAAKKLLVGGANDDCENGWWTESERPQSINMRWVDTLHSGAFDNSTKPSGTNQPQPFKSTSDLLPAYPAAVNGCWECRDRC